MKDYSFLLSIAGTLLVVTITTISIIIIRQSASERNYKSVNFQLKFEVNKSMNRKSELLTMPGYIEKSIFIINTFQPL